MVTTTLRCTQTTATIVFILIGSLFILSGCTKFYRLIGLTQEQADQQTAADQAARQKTIEEVRFTTHEIVSSAIAGLGAIASGFLARWLGTERKITAAMIGGIETIDQSAVKKSVQQKAIAAGIESKLNARVRALT